LGSPGVLGSPDTCEKHEIGWVLLLRDPMEMGQCWEGKTNALEEEEEEEEEERVQQCALVPEYLVAAWRWGNVSQHRHTTWDKVIIVPWIVYSTGAGGTAVLVLRVMRVRVRYSIWQPGPKPHP
jgi:hypothetical protein